MHKGIFCTQFMDKCSCILLFRQQKVKYFLIFYEIIQKRICICGGFCAFRHIFLTIGVFAVQKHPSSCENTLTAYAFRKSSENDIFPFLSFCEKHALEKGCVSTPPAAMAEGFCGGRGISLKQRRCANGPYPSGRLTKKVL